MVDNSQRENFLSNYPNYFDETLPLFTGCAKIENLSNAIKAFKRFCPGEFRIEEVRIRQANKKPACRWLVEYQLKGKCAEELVPLPVGKELTAMFCRLRRHHPLGVYILSEEVTFKNGGNMPDTAAVLYAVDCECDAFFDWATTKDPSLWPQDERALINEFQHIKIENEQ
ncbi:uncharacterized protein [Euwallacea similis]|uniref:uncharacterized protein n=1 Tax=Euwallacea similis TaxID=1736056 RepID=UPI00344BCE09